MGLATAVETADPRAFLTGVLQVGQIRSEDLEKMMDLLSPESDGLVRRVVILGGLGGIGKTQLAIAYIKRHGSSYESFFWLNASSDATLKGSLRSLAVRVGIVDLRNEQLDDDQVCERVLNWLSMPDNHRWLWSLIITTI